MVRTDLECKTIQKEKSGNVINKKVFGNEKFGLKKFCRT